MARHDDPPGRQGPRPLRARSWVRSPPTETALQADTLVTLWEREESEEYADLTRRIVGLLRRGKTVVVHCRGDLGRCDLWPRILDVLAYPSPQLSTTSTSTFTGTQSG